jgi:hypothetical protein
MALPGRVPLLTGRKGRPTVTRTARSLIEFIARHANCSIDPRRLLRVADLFMLRSSFLEKAAHEHALRSVPEVVR